MMVKMERLVLQEHVVQLVTLEYQEMMEQLVKRVRRD